MAQDQIVSIPDEAAQAAMLAALHKRLLNDFRAWAKVSGATYDPALTLALEPYKPDPKHRQPLSNFCLARGSLFFEGVHHEIIVDYFSSAKNEITLSVAYREGDRLCLIKFKSLYQNGAYAAFVPHAPNPKIRGDNFFDYLTHAHKVPCNMPQAA